VAFSPDKKALTVIMVSEGNFRATADRVRSVLRDFVFKDIRIGEFAAVSGYDEKGFAEALAANGTAKHRL
jgi:hypothetical protein